jgi:hypothetical protein
MKDEIGRNDLCPCGSGKKYKNAVKRKHHHLYQRILGWKKTAFILSFLAHLPPLNN